MVLEQSNSHMQIKMRYHSTPIGMSKIQNIGKPNADKDVGQQGLSFSQLTMLFQVCFQILRSVPSTHISILTPLPHCFDHWSLIISTQVRNCTSFNFVLFQNCLGCSKSSTFPHKFQKQHANFHFKKSAGVLIGIAWYLQVSFGSADILAVLHLPFHDLGVSCYVSHL